MRFPHFDFYPGDWTTDAHNRYLSLAEKGAHVELFCLMWNSASATDFGIVDDDRGISRALGVSVNEWHELRMVLVEGPYAVLEVVDGKIISPRLFQEWQKACDKSEKARENRSQRRNTTSVVRTYNERTDERTDERTTSHLSSVTKEAATTPRDARETPEPAENPIEESGDTFSDAIDYVLPLFGRTQLKGTEGPQIQTALAQVNHDFARFRVIVDELAQRADKKIRSFGYFVDRFAEEAEDRQARASPRQNSVRKPPTYKSVEDVTL